MAYRKFCESKFGKVINYPILPDTESEDEARNACKRIWCERYKDEPFDILANLVRDNSNLNSAAATEVDDPGQVSPVKGFWKQELDELVSIIARQSSFYYQVSDPLGRQTHNDPANIRCNIRCSSGLISGTVYLEAETQSIITFLRFGRMLLFYYYFYYYFFPFYSRFKNKFSRCLFDVLIDQMHA